MPTIVAIATRRIDDPLPTNVQHLMTRLAGHFQVLYIEPAVDFLYILRNFKFLLRFFNKAQVGHPQKLIPIIFPFENRLPFVRRINHFLFLTQLRLFLALNSRANIILWLFSPKGNSLIGNVGERKLYFHITDDYSAFPKDDDFESISKLKKQENSILKKADRIFVTSGYLSELYSRWSRKIRLVPNVADIGHFRKAQCKKLKVPSDIESIKLPIAGFFGALDHFKVDFDLIRYCAHQNKNMAFVLIGPIGHGDVTDENILPRAENIFYLGLKAYNQLPVYLKSFDICLIPYRITKYTQACFPLKLYEYLSAGKPVVVTNLPAVKDHWDIVYVGRSQEEFSQLIGTALKENTKSLIRARQKVAFANSWDLRVEEIKKIILSDFSEEQYEGPSKRGKEL